MDTLGNLLTSLRNAELAHRPSVSIPLSKMSRAVLDVLQKNGYLASVSEEASSLIATFPQPITTHQYRRISKPGRRIYTTAQHIRSIRGGSGMVVLSTPEGVLSGTEARKRQLGGEIICEVY